MRLSETFSSKDYRVKRVIMFIDMTDSTKMKEKDTEATWLNTFAWYFDQISEILQASGGHIVKYLGDGAMASYSDDQAAEAINAAITIQEALSSANAERIVACNCSIGIAAGTVARFAAPNGEEDYLGTVVDRAARLCSLASAKAIMVDKETSTIANMGRVKSRLGEAETPSRSASEYLSDLQRATLKGINGEVSYHEIVWDKQRYGVKSEAMTAVSVAAQTLRAEEDKRTRDRSVDKVLTGNVKRWDSEGGRGFIVGSDEQFFYTDSRFVVDKRPLRMGQKVFFLRRDPLVTGKNPLAACVVQLGDSLAGELNNIVPGRGFGFATVRDTANNIQSLLVLTGENPNALAPGDRIQFTVDENAKGPVAVDPARIT